MYDDFLHMDLPVGTSIIGFANDALVVCAADDVKIQELRINDSLWRAKRWLNSRCLKMALEKTEALQVTDRRSFKYSRIVLGEHVIEWKKSIKYLGVQLDRRLSFGEHLQIVNAKAIQCGANLARLMPNSGGLREAKRRQAASVVYSKLLYTPPVWKSALNNHVIQKKLFSAERGKELTCLTNLQEIARAKETTRKDGRCRLVKKCQTRWHCDQSGRWTHRLIPELATWLDRKHGQVDFYLPQAVSSHVCFNAYLKHFKK